MPWHWVQKAQQGGLLCRSIEDTSKVVGQASAKAHPEIPTYSLYARTPCALSIAVKPPVKDDQVHRATEHFHAWIMSRVKQTWPLERMVLHKEKVGVHTDTRLYRLYTGTNKDVFINVAMTMFETDDQRFILRGTSERLDKVQQMTQLIESTPSGQKIPEVSMGQDLPRGKIAFDPEEQW